MVMPFHTASLSVLAQQGSLAQQEKLRCELYAIWRREGLCGYAKHSWVGCTFPAQVSFFPMFKHIDISISIN